MKRDSNEVISRQHTVCHHRPINIQLVKIKRRREGEGKFRRSKPGNLENLARTILNPKKSGGTYPSSLYNQTCTQWRTAPIRCISLSMSRPVKICRKIQSKYPPKTPTNFQTAFSLPARGKREKKKKRSNQPTPTHRLFPQKEMTQKQAKGKNKKRPSHLKHNGNGIPASNPLKRKNPPVDPKTPRKRKINSGRHPENPSKLN